MYHKCLSQYSNEYYIHQLKMSESLHAVVYSSSKEVSRNQKEHIINFDRADSTTSPCTVTTPNWKSL